MKNKITQLEQGWPAHFILSRRCIFSRNTVLINEKSKKAFVVSTVGAMMEDHDYVPIGALNRMYETMVFEADEEPVFGEIFFSANTDKTVSTEAKWSQDFINHIKANQMHEAAVLEIKLRMQSGDLS